MVKVAMEILKPSLENDNFDKIFAQVEGIFLNETSKFKV